MPNWIINEVVVTGEPEVVSLFRSKCFNNENDFDFTKIIPSPERLCQLSAPPRYEIDIYLECGDDENLKTEYLKKAKRKLQDISETLATMPQEEIEENIRIGKIRMEEFLVHGCLDWYEYQCIHWGTKWNASSTSIYNEEPNELAFTFDTAWSCPYPIFEKIAKIFPLLNIEVKYCDEDVFGGNFGHFIMEYGEIEEKDMTQEEAAEFYYGDGWEEFFKEDDDEDDDDIPKEEGNAS